MSKTGYISWVKSPYSYGTDQGNINLYRKHATFRLTIGGIGVDQRPNIGYAEISGMHLALRRHGGLTFVT